MGERRERRQNRREANRSIRTATRRVRERHPPALWFRNFEKLPRQPSPVVRARRMFTQAGRDKLKLEWLAEIVVAAQGHISSSEMLELWPAHKYLMHYKVAKLLAERDIEL